MAYEHLKVEREDGAAVLVLNRPEKRNALSPALFGELCGALAAEDRNPQTCVIVITGAGDSAFCAGFDLSEGNGKEAAGTEIDGPELIESSYRKLRNVGKPVIAMINGASIGAGFDLITNCDFRFAAEEAHFSLPPVRLGIVYRWEGIRRVMDLVGPANAKDLFMTGRKVSATEACDMGLVNRVFPRSRLRQETLAYARLLIDAAPLSVCGAKQIIDILNHDREPSGANLQRIEDVQRSVWESADAQEGLLAFKEKRRPVFRGQ